MNIVKKLFIAAAVPAFAVAAVAQAPAQKAPAQQTVKTAPAKKQAAKPAPAKKQAAKPVPPKTLDQILSFLPNVLAEGKGIKITKQAFIKELSSQIPASALAQVPADQLKPIVKQMVNGMIDRELVFSIAQKNGYKPSAQLVKTEFDNMLKQLPKDKRQMLESQLKLQNKTVDSYKNEIANDPMAQKGAAFSKYLKEKIEPQCKISDADAENTKTLNLKQKYDAMGVAIRAGLLTATPEIEEQTRAELGLPPMTKEVKKAWEATGGIRQPITLKSTEEAAVSEALDVDDKAASARPLSMGAEKSDPGLYEEWFDPIKRELEALSGENVGENELKKRLTALASGAGFGDSEDFEQVLENVICAGIAAGYEKNRKRLKK